MRRFILKRMSQQNYLSFMINVFLNCYSSWDKDINFVDSRECINASISDFYENFKIHFYTCDINVNRLTSNPIFKSDPWLLFVRYNTHKEFFECDYKVKSDDILKRFVSLNFSTDTNHSHKQNLLKFITDSDIDCYYSNISENITLTEIPECFPNGYYKDRFDYGVPKEYFLGLIDIVSEGSMDMSTHFSEKSYKAIFYKKPFISLAGPYWYETFKKHGFELYDEIFDYGFDTNENKIERLEDILLQIKTLNSCEYSDLSEKVESIKPKVEHNYNRLFSLESKILNDAYFNEDKKVNNLFLNEEYTNKKRNDFI